MSTDATVPQQTQGSPSPAQAERKWRALNSIQRRIAGVLVEKAKTTPEQYPLSLNALATGCNQKNNRHPQMNLDPERVEQALDDLRRLGVVVEIQSGGRVAKYKHCLYDWLGVDKVELAVMAELLLRGEQTVGELRGRASRMEPIADLNALQPILNSLAAKGLVVELTPEGRGQVVSHALYPDSELQGLRLRYQEAESGERSETRTSPPSAAGSTEAIRQLQAEVAELRAELEQLRDLVNQLVQ